MAKRTVVLHVIVDVPSDMDTDAVIDEVDELLTPSFPDVYVSVAFPGR